MESRPLRIAMIAPPWLELPPRAYGGIESVCADLVDALVDRGHQVTLVAPGRNRTKATLVNTYREPQQERFCQVAPDVVHAVAVQRLLPDLDVDIVHDHTMTGPLLAGKCPVPTVVTVHGPVTNELRDYYTHIGADVSLVAISTAQCRARPDLPWAGMVHNAVHLDAIPFRADKEDYVVFLGRANPDKGAPLAIQAARAAGLRIVLAGKCGESNEKRYFAREVEPLLGPDAEWIGEVDHEAKTRLLGGARALLFPIRWEEPFGMVMIEAMACGTPVVALRRGSVPEVVTHGETGLICDSPDDLPAALRDVDRIDPARCRQEVADRFTADTMAEGYLRVYRSVLRDRQAVPAPRLAPATIAAT
ncbi:glycosyltransferase family 4 protein [Actinokineospora iranica]|uniref:Glycosyltransferase involved in cell wall bisynthesis n=1 Tax=Actinokineospora iranica TaxID=1271860 RepID=A0A1G6Z288_9PSEU|nr:glycosyltransferase family 4 protein [Actinokineospora iranica]SDD96854.1 Glycosyltransferase involved in cell wall bisynthesis [Actinokineospora iranica]